MCKLTFGFIVSTCRCFRSLPLGYLSPCAFTVAALKPLRILSLPTHAGSTVFPSVSPTCFLFLALPKSDPGVPPIDTRARYAYLLEGASPPLTTTHFSFSPPPRRVTASAVRVNRGFNRLLIRFFALATSTRVVLLSSNLSRVRRISFSFLQSPPLLTPSRRENARYTFPRCLSTARRLNAASFYFFLTILSW